MCCCTYRSPRARTKTRYLRYLWISKYLTCISFTKFSAKWSTGTEVCPEPARSVLSHQVLSCRRMDKVCHLDLQAFLCVGCLGAPAETMTWLGSSDKNHVVGKCKTSHGSGAINLAAECVHLYGCVTLRFSASSRRGKPTSGRRQHKA